MRGDQRYRLAAHQCPQSTHESQIDLMWPAKTDLPGFAVGTLAETNPVVGQGQGGQSFLDAHGVDPADLVVVADAGMMSYTNLTALDEASLSFIEIGRAHV